MEPMSCNNAFYVKLGRNGIWEKSSLTESVIRIGWREQKIADINQGKWDKIQRNLEQEMGDKGAATRDCRALRMLCESTPNDVWITFHANHLWWCRVAEARVYEDTVSKYRKVNKWFSHDIFGNPLLITAIPGSIAKLQGFRGTICRVGQVEDLTRILNRQHSSEYVAILHSKDELSRHVERGIRRLHWKDFEILVDLVFRASGWRRVSVLGETMNYADIELEDPITGEMYQVQVKSAAALRDFRDYCTRFSGGKYRKLFFVVHSPDKKLAEHPQNDIDSVALITPARLAQMVVDLGLVNWLMNKIR